MCIEAHPIQSNVDIEILLWGMPRANTGFGRAVKMKCAYGVPGRIRTRDPLLRRQPLYPTELQGRAEAVQSSVATPISWVKKYQRIGFTECA